MHLYGSLYASSRHAPEAPPTPASGTPKAASLHLLRPGPVRAAPRTLPCPAPHSLLLGSQCRRGEAILSGTDRPGRRRDPCGVAARRARAHPAPRSGRPLGCHRDVARAERTCGPAPLGNGRPLSLLLPARAGPGLRLGTKSRIPNPGMGWAGLRHSPLLPPAIIRCTHSWKCLPKRHCVWRPMCKGLFKVLHFGKETGRKKDS